LWNASQQQLVQRGKVSLSIHRCGRLYANGIVFSDAWISTHVLGEEDSGMD